MTYTDQDFDFWIKNNYNVLIKGRKGVGKTSTILAHLNRHNLKYKYFSASTMDPWVDFIGVPKEKVEDGKSYLELVLPKSFADDEVEVLILDEYNRAPKKVRNAVMELIQFKSINGRKFENLRFVWAAINPKEEDESYDVEDLDPAQEDRFEVQIEFPYLLDKNYWIGKYGEDIYTVASAYWNGLSAKLQLEVSPRRLDYAVSAVLKGGSIKHFLKDTVNPEKLSTLLGRSGIFKKVDEAIDEVDLPKVRGFVKQPNIWDVVKSYLLEKATQNSFMTAVYCLPAEVRNKEFSLFTDDQKTLFCTTVVDLYPKDDDRDINQLTSFYYSLGKKEHIDIIKTILPEEKADESLDLHTRIKSLVDVMDFHPRGGKLKDDLTINALDTLQHLNFKLFTLSTGQDITPAFVNDKWDYICAAAVVSRITSLKLSAYNKSSYKKFSAYRAALNNCVTFTTVFGRYVNGATTGKNIYGDVKKAMNQQTADKYGVVFNELFNGYTSDLMMGSLGEDLRKCARYC